MDRYQAVAERLDGSIAGPVRVTIGDKLAANRAARQLGLTPEEDGPILQAWLGWHALHRAGELDCTWPELEACVIDIDVEEVPADAPADPADPTQPTPPPEQS